MQGENRREQKNALKACKLLAVCMRKMTYDNTYNTSPSIPFWWTYCYDFYNHRRRWVGCQKCVFLAAKKWVFQVKNALQTWKVDARFSRFWVIFGSQKMGVFGHLRALKVDFEGCESWVDDASVSIRHADSQAYLHSYYIKSARLWWADPPRSV